MSSKSRFKTLPDIEREWFYQEEEKWKKQSILTTPMSIIDKVPGYDRKKQLFFKPINTISSIQDDNLEILNRARVMPNSQSGTYKNSPSTSVWLKSLKSKSGMDVVNFWLKEAEKNQHNLEFHEWLESIRETLGPEKYRIWLENVRSQTSHSKKFQDWLPIPLPIENNYNQNLNQYNDFESKINDMEGEILSVFPKTRLDDTFEILENGDILTTMKPVEKFSNFNNSINTSEMGNNSIIPTFIIIQTLPNELTPSISNPQMFNHQILDPTNNKKFQPKFRNFRTPFPTYQYLPKNDYHQQIKSSSQFLPWFNLLNYSPNDQSTTTQLNQNLIPENYLQNFLLPLQDQKSIIYWYHPAFGYINLHPQYDINNNYDDESIDDKNNYFQRKDKFHSRRRINWGEFFKNRNKNNFPKNSRRKELLDKQNFEIDNDNKNEEEEIQFLKKILQEILDYNFEEKILDENENKNSRDSEKIMRNEKHEKKKKIHKNERKKEIESENKKENEQENENENAKDNEKEKTKKQERKKQNKKSKKKENEKNEKEIENNSDDVLMETLFNMIKEQLSNNQDNVTNLQLEMLLDEVGKNENDTQLLTDEFEKFLENFENPEEETDDDT